jgi:hypothetical protein
MKKTLQQLLAIFVAVFAFANTNAQIVFSEDFSSWTPTSTPGWTLIDADGDGRNWLGMVLGGVNGTVAVSESFVNGFGPLTPDNYMISGEIDIPANGSTVLRWDVWAIDQNWPAEQYSVYVVEGTTIADVEAGDLIHNQTLTAGPIETVTVDLSDYAGETVRLAFRHHDCENEFRIAINNIEVENLLANNITLNSIDTPSLISTGEAAIQFTVTNAGGDLVESITAEYQVNESTVVTETFIDLDLAFGESVTLSFDELFDFEEGSASITVEVTAVNGEDDEDDSDNLLIKIINVQEGFLTYLFEDFEDITEFPDGWSQEFNAGSDGWLIGTTEELSSPFWTIPPHGKVALTNDDECNCNKANDRLILPTMSFASGMYYIKFDYILHGGAGESAFLEASTNGSTWSTVMQLQGGNQWFDDNFIILEDYEGVSQITFRFRYNDNGQWAYGAGVDNIEIAPLSEVGISIMSLDVLGAYSVAATPNITFDFTVLNSGASTINSLTVETRVDDILIGTDEITGLSIETADEFQVSTISPYPAVAGTRELEITITHVNGNELSQAVVSSRPFLVANATYDRTVLVESFSSNTCGPCAVFNVPIFSPAFAQNNANNPTSDLAVVKYQLRFPAPGTDPSASTEALARQQYYSVNSIPNMHVDGVNWAFQAAGLNPNNPSNSIQIFNDKIAAEAEKPALFDITGGFVFNEDNQISVNAIVEAGFDVNPNEYRLHVSVNNTAYTFGGGTTSETNFKHIKRKMLPNQNGTTLPAMAAESSQSFTFSHSFSVGGVAQANFNLWNTDVEVVVFVQRISDRAIMQAKSLPSQPVGINELTSINKLKMFPNPTNSGEAMLNFNLVDAKQVSVEVFNLTGQLVGVSNLGNVAAGEVFHTVDITNQPAGIYLVRIIAGNETTTLRLAKN